MLRALSILAVLVVASVTRAQVLDVSVGITPACPYGLSACWGGAEQGLTRMSGVASVTHKPDATNSIADVKLTSSMLPDLSKWSDQFHAVVGQVYAFRGVEVLARGTVVRGSSGELEIHIPGIKDPLVLLPMRHKLQWAYRQGKARAITPDEAAAFGNLKTLIDTQVKGGVTVRLTGPLASMPLAIGHTGSPSAIEVRSFAVDDPRVPTTMPSPTTAPMASRH